MLLNHPETIPPPPQSMEKLSSTKPFPGAKNAGDYCLKEHRLSEMTLTYWSHSPESKQDSSHMGLSLQLFLRNR